MHFDPTRENGLERLHSFLPSAGRAYATERNYDYGPDQRGNISLLSPWVRHRLVTEPEIIRATLEQHAFGSAEKFIMEVYWRAYFKGWLEQHPTAWDHYKTVLSEELASLARDNRLANRYQTAIAGETGIDCFDFWAKELTETGYLHNHARMWFASIWIFTLELPWVLGADFFYRHLLDGDPASNTLSWRWVAGLHTKGKHYVARAENIRKFTNGRFNTLTLLNENPLPLSEDPEIKQVPMPRPAGPRPHKRSLLLITEEDCHLESLPLKETPAELVVLDCSQPIDSEKKRAFKRGALEDAARRAREHFGQDIKQVSPDELPKWVRENAIEQIITGYLPVGPVRDQMEALRAALDESGCSISMVMRDHDRNAWPHATRGFFKLKKQIPRLLEAS